MKRVLLTLAMILCTMSMWAQQKIELTAQQANDRVNGYVGAGDYVSLSRELPALREAIVPHLLKLADALVAYHEGRHAESNQYIAELEQYRKELGDGVIVTMQNIAYYNALAMEDYAAASQYLKLLMAAAPEQQATLAKFGQWMDAMPKRKGVRIKRSKRDRVVPVECRTVGEGAHIMLKAMAGRKSVDMIFDTGCCNANCITEEAAKRLGVKVLADSLPLGGVGGSTYAKVGVLPKLKLGDVVVKNPTFFIVESIVEEESAGKIEAVLGTHVIRAMGEIQIDLDNSCITLPAKQSEDPAHRNLTFDAGNYGIEFSCERDVLLAHFDTGRTKSDLSQRFYGEYRDVVESSAGHRVRSRRSGVGGSREIDVYRMPAISLNIADRLVVFSNIDVIINGQPTQWYGIMGVDFLQGAGRVTLDLQRMFLRIDK